MLDRSGTAPRRTTAVAAYVVCTTPRTGSGVLGEALWQSGVAGRPDEYFNRATAREYMTAWRVGDPHRYVDAVLAHATTANGVLGMKLMAEQLPSLARSLGARSRDPFAGLDALAARLPRVTWIVLTRRDRVRQAISYWKALHAGAFASTDARAADADARLLAAFDPAAIDRLLAEIDRGNVAWRTYFRTRALAPLRLVYEDDLHDGLAPGAAKVLAALGVAPPADPPVAVTRRPQADALTDTLLARYRAAGGRAVSA